MSKIPYISGKNALKAKKKFMKELSKDKEAERIYLKELNLEMEILTSSDALETENEEEIEMEMPTETTFSVFEDEDAMDDDDDARTLEAMETDESGDFEE